MNPVTDILTERVRQDGKWGEQNHSPFYWLGIIGEEFGEVSKDLIEGNVDGYRTELIHLAAVTIGAIQSLDRNLERDRKEMAARFAGQKVGQG